MRRVRRTTYVVRGAAALALVALAAFPASAAAHRHHHHAHAARFGPSRLTLALTVATEKAHQLWGVEPCGGHFTLAFVRTEAWSGHTTWSSPSGFNYESPPESWTECAIELSAEEWTPASIEMSWPLLCTIVMHEYGHLTGHAHSDEAAPGAPGVAAETAEQASVMESGNGDTAVDLARCGWEP